MNFDCEYCENSLVNDEGEEFCILGLEPPDYEKCKKLTTTKLGEIPSTLHPVIEHINCESSLSEESINMINEIADKAYRTK